MDHKVCDKILHVFMECAAIDKNTTNSYKKTKCIEAEKLHDSAWITAYTDCVKKYTVKKCKKI